MPVDWNYKDGWTFEWDIETTDPYRNWIKTTIPWTPIVQGESIFGVQGTAKAIDKVIFNPPATIVFWEDGSKTVVKASKNDEFKEEIGLAMAIVNKMLGKKEFKNALKDAERHGADSMLD